METQRLKRTKSNGSFRPIERLLLTLPGDAAALLYVELCNVHDAIAFVTSQLRQQCTMHNQVRRLSHKHMLAIFVNAMVSQLHAGLTLTGIISSGCCCPFLPCENRDSNLFRFSCCFSSSAGCALPDCSGGFGKLLLGAALHAESPSLCCGAWLLVVAAS